MLALVVIGLMLARARTDADSSGTPRVIVDPVLLLSAVGVILLALAAWRFGQA